MVCLTFDLHRAKYCTGFPQHSLWWCFYKIDVFPKNSYVTNIGGETEMCYVCRHKHSWVGIETMQNLCFNFSSCSTSSWFMLLFLGFAQCDCMITVFPPDWVEFDLEWNRHGPGPSDPSLGLSCSWPWNCLLILIAFAFSFSVHLLRLRS